MTSTERVRHLRHQRKAAGLCIDCGRAQIVSMWRCEFHALVQRRRNTLYKRRWLGSLPRYLAVVGRAVHAEPARYATASHAEAWEWLEGRNQKIWVDWRDPLLILMAREARGLFQFLGKPSPLFTRRTLVA